MSCYTPITIKSPLHEGAFITVPCGKCSGCRKAYRDSWFLRFREEAKGQFSRFITLTYNDENIPTRIDDDAVIHYDVSKDDIRKFLRKMRKSEKFKHFLVSEYGTEDHRPHYHMLLFSPKRIDVERFWKFGFVKDLPAHKGSYKYVTKYLLKGSDGVPAGNLPNFMTCSKRPAIGLKYLDTKLDDNDYLNMTMRDNETIYPLPRYYRKKLYERLNDGGEKTKQLVLNELESRLPYSKLESKMKDLGHDPDNEDVLKFFKQIERKHEYKQRKIKNQQC